MTNLQAFKLAQSKKDSGKRSAKPASDGSVESQVPEPTPSQSMPSAEEASGDPKCKHCGCQAFVWRISPMGQYSSPTDSIWFNDGRNRQDCRCYECNRPWEPTVEAETQ